MHCRLFCTLLSFLILQISLSRTNDVLPSRRESIKVQLPGYEEEILSCTLIVIFSSRSFFYIYRLYNKESLFSSDGMFKYVGKDDNTCSFEIFPNEWSGFFSYANGNPLVEEWTVYERHVTDGSRYKTLKSWLGASTPDKRQFNFYVSPQTFGERIQMAMSGHHVTRNITPYTNETITIFTQPKKHLVSKCILFISSDYLFRRNRKIVLYDMHSSFSSLAKYGFEFIGVDDNSCSFRIFIDTLERKKKKYFDIIWIIYEISGTDLSSMLYEFNMPSILWWQKNKKSGLYLSENLLANTKEEYF